MKICYVSMAFGVKHDTASGRTVDNDRIYRELIMPAVQAAGLSCQRADDFAGALIHKDIVKAVITADVMLADVSNGNPNVMYELGIRHALRRGATVLLTSTPLPFNIANSYALHYDVALDGGPAPDRLETVRNQLVVVLLEKFERMASDSPLYEYFPELRIELPADLQPPDLRRRTYPVEAQVPPARGPDRKTAVARAEQATRSIKDVDPQAFIDLLRRYLNLGEIPEVVRLAGELPPNVAELPQVAQIVARAQDKLGNTDAAIYTLKRSLSLTGGDPETHGLLGSLYKRRFLAHGSPENLDAAIDHYRRGFEGNPQDLYLGQNLALLLHRKGGDAARDELSTLLPELRSLAQQRLDDRVPDYWLFDSALILAVLATDYTAADALVNEMLMLCTESWMLDITRTDLQGVLERLSDSLEIERLRALIGRLIPAPAADEAEEADDAQL